MTEQITDLSKLNVLVFGGTGGLGRAISQNLASRGAQVTVIGQTFRDSDIKNINFIKTDLSSIKSSQNLAHELDVTNVDLVLFTTGILASKQKQETSEGLEKDMAVSYLNRLSILKILLPKLPKSTNHGFKGSRIFIMGFPGNNQLGSPKDLNQDETYHYWTTHMNTVAGNESLVTSLSKTYPQVKIFGLNPNLVKTNIRSNLFGDGYLGTAFESVLGWFTNTPEQYANVITPLLVSPELNDDDGGFYNHKGQKIPGSKGLDKEYADEFIDASVEVLKKKGIDV
ncbi:Retinol dehydrogenase 14 [Wickerhamomyces ciferrii]|uniref:Retinol dehydrogenase 14 n=1 Tax=Wickerhamomyces ciferrii (strain ATCC 14091 / BCRC 22168 / CBS 111 / JCM 3599 / NBRC 0793 / NRRL Y-1031 F-60-10) TaxID=1206466 RepID=K0KTV9_WICCF|nr:Retinol dehydrogenase 14 [Wickerhamomyces ciferrii]CCH45457.1 Retinol dehydrogenase 14 [Wickerhamomyces ciferrii]